MNRLVARSLVAAALAAAGCGPQNTTPVDPIGPSTPPQIIDPSACGNDPNASGTFGNSGGPTGGPMGPSSQFVPRVGVTHTADVAPPAISGGTLRVLADGKTVVASDPDRDQIYVVDLATRKVLSTIKLNAGDEPGRVATDAAGRAHIALRHGGALVTIDPAAGTITARREVCAAPRGIGYDAAADLLHVACADGQLVSLPAAGGGETRRLQLDGDLRDVIVDGPRLQVTRFRSAELLTIGADGKIANRIAPTPFSAQNVRSGQIFTPSIAWRAMAMPTGGVAILHQRGLNDEVNPVVGGYGGFSSCDAIIQTAVTVVAPGQEAQTGPAMAGLVLAVDMDISKDGQRMAVISAGNATNSSDPNGTPQMPRVFVTDMNSASDTVLGCANDGTHAPCMPLAGFVGPVSTPGEKPTFATAGSAGASGTDLPSTGAAPPSGQVFCNPDGTTSSPDLTVPQVMGQPIAVAFAGNGNVVVQSREPALLSFPGGAPIALSTQSREDTGHTLFHANAGGLIACASCHAEGNDDARVWTFASCSGSQPRRTQSLQVGLRGTEPFHWGGDEMNFPQLVSDVFVGRMSGPKLENDQVDATLTWIDAQPRLARAAVTMTSQIERGHALFNDAKSAACSTCHSGTRLTNNTSVDVGTGGKFQVPSLVGIGTRGPFMHNGCAATLKDRFGACGGGDKHGVTSKLAAGQIDDLVAYLNTL